MFIKFIKTLPVSAGLVTIVILPLISPFFGPTLSMHTSSPVRTMAVAVIIILVVSTLGGSAVWTWITSQPLKNHLFVIACAFIFPLCLDDLFALLGYLGDKPNRSLMLFGIAACYLILTWMRRTNLDLYRSAQRAVMILFSGIGLCSTFLVCQLLALGFRHPVECSSTSEDASIIHAARRHGRVVWILFDELAFQQTFGHRDSQLSLPRLDAFRQQSTLYTRVFPVGELTELAVPSLLLGQQLTKIRSRYDGEIEVVSAGEKTWRRYPPSQTLLGEARALGYKSGIDGWYNSYCTLLYGQWDSCFWTGTAVFRGMAADAGIFENIRSIILDYALALIAPEVLKQRQLAADALRRQREFELLMENGIKLLAQPDFDFIFIHLSVPHPSAFYNRRTRQFGPGGSYLDGLAVTDLAAGRLLDELKSSPLWPRTSVVICGDHSFRVHMYRPTGYWTAEDERATDGVFEPNPLVMIHAAGQQTSATVNAPTSLMVVHSALENMLRH